MNDLASYLGDGPRNTGRGMRTGDWQGKELRKRLLGRQAGPPWAPGADPTGALGVLAPPRNEGTGYLFPNPMCCGSRAVSGACLPRPSSRGWQRSHQAGLDVQKSTLQQAESAPGGLCYIGDSIRKFPCHPHGTQGSVCWRGQRSGMYFRHSSEGCGHVSVTAENSFSGLPPRRQDKLSLPPCVLYPQRYPGSAGGSGTIDNVLWFQRTAISRCMHVPYSSCISSVQFHSF